MPWGGNRAAAMSSDECPTCSLCQDICTAPVMLNCTGQHRVCTKCYIELVGQDSKCPLCKTVVPSPYTVLAAPPGLSSIFVVNMAGKRSLYEVNGGTKVAELMLMIQDRDGINPELYRLIWAARVMEDDKTLSDYNLQNLQVLQLVMRHKGGARRVRSTCASIYALSALWVDVIIVAERVQDSASGLADAY